MEEKSRIKKIDRQMAIKGHTIASLAQKTGLSKLTIREVLYCERFPSAKTSLLIAEAIEMDVEEFRASVYDAKQQTQKTA